MKNVSTKQTNTQQQASNPNAQRLKQILNSSKRPNARQLFNLGLSGGQVTQILSNYERNQGASKLKNLDVNQFFNKLNSGRGRIIADNTSQTQAFKIGVNNELRRSGKKTLSFNKNVSEFNDAIEKLQNDRKKSFARISNVDRVKSDISKNISSIENKVNTGQSVTPKELKAYNELLTQRGKNTTKQQLKLGKDLLLSPVNYGKNLVVRKQSGEKSPLYNDLVRFAKGIKSSTVDVLADIGGSVLNGTEFTLAQAFNYGIRITKEAQKGNFVIDDDIKKVGRTIIRGARSISEKTVKVTNFVKKNPKQSAVIVGSAVGNGFIFVGKSGRKIVRLTSSQYSKDPAYFLGQVFGLTIGQAAITKGALITGRAGLTGADLLVKSTNKAAKKFNSAIIKYVNDVKKTPTKQQRKNLVITALVESANLNEKSSKIYKDLIKKKSLRELESILKNRNKQIKLESKVNSKSPSKITKEQAKRNLLVTTLRENGFKGSLAKLSLNQLQREVNRLPKVSKKTSSIAEPTINRKNLSKQAGKNLNKIAKNEGKGGVIRGTPKKVFIDKKRQSDAAKANLIKLAKQDSKSKLRQSSRRVVLAKPESKLQKKKNLLARTLTEARKQSEIYYNRIRKSPLSKLETQVNKLPKVNVKKTKSKVSNNNTVIDIPDQKARKLGIALVENSSEPSIKVFNSLSASKKAQVQRGVQIQLTEVIDEARDLTKAISQKLQEGGKVISANLIKLERLKFKLRRTRSRLVKLNKVKGYSILSSIGRVNAVINRIDTFKLRVNRNLKTSKLKPGRGTNNKNNTKTNVKSKVGSKPKSGSSSKVSSGSKSAQDTKSGQQSLQRLKSLLKAKSISKQIFKKVYPRLDLSWSTPLPKGFRLAFGFEYRSKGRIKRINTKLPLRKALKQFGKAIDDTTSLRGKIFITGITRESDLRTMPTVVKKFQKVRDKNGLNIQEKRRFFNDTKGERRNLTIKGILSKRRKK